MHSEFQPFPLSHNDTFSLNLFSSTHSITINNNICVIYSVTSSRNMKANLTSDVRNLYTITWTTVILICLSMIEQKLYRNTS